MTPKSAEEKELSNSDQWFSANLRCLLGAEEALVKGGHQSEINRKMLAEWVIEHSQFRSPYTQLPSLDEAGVIAIDIAANADLKFTAKEEALFIAAFQECIKYLSSLPSVKEPESKERYFRCNKCGLFITKVTNGEDRGGMCTGTMAVRTSGVCGGGFTIGMTKAEYIAQLKEWGHIVKKEEPRKEEKQTKTKYEYNCN